jgi:sugar phosphate isomerase/epimerase
MPDLPLGAVIALDFKTWDVRDEIALLHQVGVGRVQIYRNYVQGLTARRVRETLEAAGLVADSLHGYFQADDLPGPPCDLSSADPAGRWTSLDLMRGEAEFARRLGCRDIIIHPIGTGSTPGDAWRAAALAESADELARIGEAMDVRFLVENMPPPYFGSDARPLRRIADALASPRLGLAYDSGHAMLVGDPVGLVRLFGPRLGGVHLHDNFGKQDDHLIPGMGSIPFEDVARALAEVGYGGTFMIEVYRPTDEVRRDLTPERLAFIDRLRRLASGQPSCSA